MGALSTLPAHTPPMPASNKVFLGEDGLIRNVYVGDQDAESVKGVERETVRLATDLRALGRPVHILANIDAMGRSSPGSRKAARDALELHVYDRCAVTGGNLFLRHLSNLINMASRRAKDVRWLPTEEDAILWLRSPP